MPLPHDFDTPREGMENYEPANHPLAARQTTLASWDASRLFDHPRAIDTILYGGLAAGLLSVLDDVVVYSLQGRNPIEFLQFIASGAIGKEAFAGGYETAALGTVFHFLIAFVTGAVFYEASRILPTLYRRPVVWGPVFGLAVYIVMNYVVLPLSAVPRSPFSFALLLNGLIGHAVLVGLPIALIASRSARARRMII
ncbi:MAG: DUF1440 domain-containing protein [Bryobacteraceae bacterium]